MSRNFLLELMPKKSICAEIGVWRGDFSKKIIDIIDPIKLHLIDPWSFQNGEDYKDAWYGKKIGNQKKMDGVFNYVIKRFESEIKEHQVIVHRNTSDKAHSNFPDNFFDWVYIDGDHAYEFVKKDIELFMKKVKKGGFITGDDYIENGWWGDGVKKAVDEAVSEGKIKKIIIKDGQFILKKI